MKLEFTDSAKATGIFKIFTRKKGTEEWNLRASGKNIIVNGGVNLMRDNTFGTQADEVAYGAVSDEGSAPIATDSSLGGNEIRVAFQPGYPNNDIDFKSSVEYFIDATQWAGAGMTAVNKAGLYFRVSGAFLFNGASFTELSVDADTEMLVRWEVTLSDT